MKTRVYHYVKEIVKNPRSTCTIYFKEINDRFIGYNVYVEDKRGIYHSDATFKSFTEAREYAKVFEL